MKSLLQTFLLLFFFLVKMTAKGQQSESDVQKLQGRIQQIEQANRKLAIQLRNTEARLTAKIKATTDSAGKLQGRLNEANANIRGVQETLGIEIEKSKNDTNGKITDLTASLSKSTLYWIIAVLTIAVLSLVLFLFLRYRFKKTSTSLSDSIQHTNKALESQHASLSDSIHDTKKALQEESIRLDTKLANLLETQLTLLKQERSSQAKEEDHSLALKMADEINRIQKNISQMDSSTKGLKQLNASVKRIIESFEANGYELVDMLGKQYKDGMNVLATFKADDTLEPGERIISKLIKPQIIFKGTMIQSAEVEVSVGE